MGADRQRILRKYPVCSIKAASCRNIAASGFPQILCLSAPMLGVINMMTSYFQALGKAVRSLTITVLRNAALFIPGVIILNHIWQLNGVIAAQPVVETILTSLTVSAAYRKTCRQSIPVSSVNGFRGTRNFNLCGLGLKLRRRHAVKAGKGFGKTFRCIISPAPPEEQAIRQTIAECIVGEFGVCVEDIDDGEHFHYYIAGAYQGGAVPEGMSVLKGFGKTFRCIISVLIGQIQHGPVSESFRVLLQRAVVCLGYWRQRRGRRGTYIALLLSKEF